MKTIKSIFSLICMLVIAQALMAQTSPKTADIKEVREKRAELLTEELDLTNDERQKLVPLVDKYMKERFDLYNQHKEEAKKYRAKKEKTNEDYNYMIDSHLDAETKKLELEKRFYLDMRKILPAKKVYEYRNAERKFMNRMLESHNKARKERKKNN